MIVFLESDTNPFTVNFNPPIYAVSEVKVLSCSLFNSWYNLVGGEVWRATTYNGQPAVEAADPGLPDSHYTPLTLAKELAKTAMELATGLPHEMKLTNKGTAEWVMGPALGGLLGIAANTRIAVNDSQPVVWKVPQAYEVHCNLVRTYQNGRWSHLMAQFTPKGEPFDLVEYRPYALKHPLATGMVESLSIDIKIDGQTVDFRNRKIKLVLDFI